MELPKKYIKNIRKPTHFGKNLKFLRRMNGLSQNELGKQLELSRNNIASYESGIIEPNMKKFLATCIYFRVEPRDMLESILSEKPTEIINIENQPEKIIDKYLSDEMEEFVIQTNEMTKVFEGYKTFFEMRKESATYAKNKDLYSTLEDLLELLQSLVSSNWTLIQSVYPIDNSSKENSEKS